MLIRVTAAGPTLEAADDLKRFKLLVEGGLADEALRQALGAAGRLDGAHVWVAQDWLRAAAPMRDDPAWQAAFAQLLGFAAQHGWVEAATGAICAHIEAA